MKKGVMNLLLAASLSNCVSNNGNLKPEEGMPEYQMTINVDAKEIITIFVMPCGRAGVWMNQNGYTIRCSDELYFKHELNKDQLRFGGVSYFDNDCDGNVDQLSVNEISVDIYDPSIDMFYKNKLRELNKDYAQEEWERYLRRRLLEQ